MTEAQAHSDLTMPPLTQTLSQLRAELTDPQVMAWGIREGGRLVASVRIRQADRATAEVGRLVVAPDRQGSGLGTALLLAAEARLPGDVAVIRLFTGEHSEAQPAPVPAAGLPRDGTLTGRQLSPRAPCQGPRLASDGIVSGAGMAGTAAVNQGRPGKIALSCTPLS